MLLLLFQIGEVRYALDTANVLEIAPMAMLRPLLHAPRGVAGLLDYHATPVPVLDLSELATGQPAETRFSTRLILVQIPAKAAGEGLPRVIGLVAERATGLLQRQPADFTSTGLTDTGAPFLGPVTADADGFIHRVSVEELLTGPIGALLATAEILAP